MIISVHVQTVACSISNFVTISQANTDFEAKIREALYIKIYTRIKPPNISLWFFIFVEYFFRHALYLFNQILFVIFFITVLDVSNLRCKHLKRKL